MRKWSWFDYFLFPVRGKISQAEAARRMLATKKKAVVVTEVSNDSTPVLRSSPIKRLKPDAGVVINLSPDFLSQEGVDTSIWPEAEKLFLPAASRRLLLVDDVHLAGRGVEYLLQVSFLSVCYFYCCFPCGCFKVIF